MQDMKISLRNQLTLILLLTVTLFTSNVVPHAIEKPEVHIEDSQGGTHPYTLFGPILTICLIAFDMLVLLGGVLVTKLTLNQPQSQKAKFFDNSHKSEKIPTLQVTTANTLNTSGDYYDAIQDYSYNSYNNSYNDGYEIEIEGNEDYHNEVYDEYYEYIEENDDEENDEITIQIPNQTRSMELPNKQIPHINSTRATQIIIPRSTHSSSSTNSTSSRPSFVQFPAPTARTERKKFYSYI